jgi:hypothetical protein
MRLGIVVMPMMSWAMIGCSAASAEAPDASNPFHCGVAFSVYKGIAEASGKPGAEMLGQRMKVEAAKAAALPESKRTRAEGEALMKRLLADPDEAYETVVACMKRQDAEQTARKTN